MKSSGSIGIAGYSFGLFNTSKLPLVFDEGFKDFLGPITEQIDVHLIFHEGLQTFEKQSPSYQAKNANQLLWEILPFEDKRLYLVYHPENGTLQQQALYDEKKRAWQIYSAATQHEDERVLHPLAYPMAPLLWYVLSTEEPLLLVHASGVFEGQRGRIFSGFSGVGKSTMAQIWHANGAQVINDDRLLLKRNNRGNWQMYNTPMHYYAKACHAPLNAVYFPFHNPVNTHEKMQGAKALATVLAYTIHHGYDPKHILHHSNLAEQLSTELSIAKLGVVPNHEVIDFIKNHESL
jgi:hypothetical protein